MTNSVKLRGVSKSFRIYGGQKDRLKEALSFGRRRHSRDFWALRDVDLDLEPGTTLGVVGRNGAGKSTLLQIISGVLEPTRGTVEVRGKLVLLQLGAGFNPQFTGRENVMLNGLILGIDRRKMIERMDEIEAFADIGEFMDQPVKTYSSGMRARLGFAVAINVEPDVLIVDETLSVGDAVFKQMSLQKMREMRKSGTTILFVSHSLGMVKNFCNEAVLLHEGRVLHHGDTAETMDRYGALLAGIQARSGGGELDYAVEEEDDEDAAPSFKEDPSLRRRGPGLRHGTGEARITSVEVLDAEGNGIEAARPGSTVIFRAHLEYAKSIPNSVLGITLRNRAGLDVFSTDTAIEKTQLGKRERGERLIVDFAVEVPLQPGPYGVAAALSYPGKEVHLDWVDVAATLKIRRMGEGRPIPGLVHLPTAVEIHDPR
jgi:ABC-2 type transport system ATP-binding protein